MRKVMVARRNSIYPEYGSSRGMGFDGSAWVVRKIIDEHRALDRLFATTLEMLGGGGGSKRQIEDAFEELRKAMESHLGAEETLYFPTIWDLLPEFKDRLRAFIRAHHRFRGHVQEIAGLMESDEMEEATYVLEGLRLEFGRHERGEEDALRSLDQEILDGETK
ncbi:MAG: hypothetical protein CL933_11960 [Deltaproteobacteria bacterium]|nr:hypothetical protein [Deltaproteobacteria bacterium]